MAKQTTKAPPKASAAQRKAPKGPELPQTREALLDLHRDTRKRRNKAKHGSPEHVEAIDLLGPDRGRDRPHRAGDGPAARLIARR